MKKRQAAFFVIVGAMTLMMACQQQQQQQAVEDPVKRGEYLVTIGGCNDCHSPKLPGPIPVPDESRLLSGHPSAEPYPTWSPADLQDRNAIALTSSMLSSWAGPWGVSFAANLTPDKATGLGNWTEESFIRALRTGKHLGQADGREILPPMPWPTIARMTDSDLKAMWAYLQSLPAIENQVPAPIPPDTMPGGGQ